MELFVLKLVAIICTTILSITIVISRKDDIGISAVVLTILFELAVICILFNQFDQIITFIEGFI